MRGAGGVDRTEVEPCLDTALKLREGRYSVCILSAFLSASRLHFVCVLFVFLPVVFPYFCLYFAYKTGVNIDCRAFVVASGGMLSVRPAFAGVCYCDERSEEKRE